MSRKDTLNKAYGNVPKEVSLNIGSFYVPVFRGIRYYWIKLFRKITRK